MAKPIALLLTKTFYDIKMSARANRGALLISYVPIAPDYMTLKRINNRLLCEALMTKPSG